MLPLAKPEQRRLLALAREAIAAAVGGGSFDPAAHAELLPEELREPAAAFVSLHREGRLRGCVGYVAAGKPLYLTVAEAAVAAALHDNRFPPLGVDELVDLEVEISVLSPFVLVSPEEVQPGEHGLYITEGWQRGLLLPQVAREHGWSRERFLEETCAKAGLPRDAWKGSARVEAFTAQVFSEADVTTEDLKPQMHSD